MNKFQKYSIFKISLILALSLLLSTLFKIAPFLNEKICICTVGKLENKYIREFVEYYILLGVDKIYLYDNNEINGEKFDEVIYDYINNKYVDVVNYRGERGNLIKIMDDCYQQNYNNYKLYLNFDYSFNNDIILIYRNNMISNEKI